MQCKFLRYSLSALTGLAIVSFVSTAFPSSQLLAQTSKASLAQWYEQANQYYHAVQSGNAKKPPPAEWNQFLSQMQWARQQLGGTMATKKGPQQTGEQDYFVRMWNQPAGGIQTKTGASGVPSKSNAAAKYGGFYESFVIKGKNSNPTSSAPKKQPVENLNTVIQGSRIRFLGGPSALTRHAPARMPGFQFNSYPYASAKTQGLLSELRRDRAGCYSFVRRVCYDRTKRFMAIKLNNTWYPYCEVPEASVKALLTSSSVGTHYNIYFRSNPDGRRGPFDCRDRPMPDFSS